MSSQRAEIAERARRIAAMNPVVGEKSDRVVEDETARRIADYLRRIVSEHPSKHFVADVLMLGAAEFIERGEWRK